MENKISNNEIKKQNFWQKLSTMEKSFWITIGVLVLMVLGLSQIGEKRQEKLNVKESIISLHQIEKNLVKNQDILDDELNVNLEDVKGSIDKEIDVAFEYAFNNIDGYLDWHYSIVGEYVQMGTLATGELSNTIQTKLLGGEFNKKLQFANENIGDTYKVSVDKYYSKFKDLALQDINETQNFDTLNDVDLDMENFIKLQQGKMALVGAGLSGAILTKMAARLAGKTVLKVAAKATAKTATKLGATATAAAAGLSCGPMAPVCGTGLALVTWFSVDAVFVNVDEYLNREELKEELLEQLKIQKIRLKNSYKEMYGNHFKNLSTDLIEKYSTIETKKTVRESIWK